MQPGDDFIEKLSAYFNVSSEDLLISEKDLQNPYKDELIKELRSRINLLEQTLSYVTDGKIKSDSLKLTGNLKTAGDGCRIVAFDAPKVTLKAA